MYWVFVVFLLGFAFIGYAFAEEPRLATYHEIATVIVDQRFSNNVTASISLQTTSIQEFLVPPDLDLKIRNNTDITAVIITNEDQCILGVDDQICIMVNTQRIQGEGIRAIQEKARHAGDSLIDDINETFDLNAKFHSIFVHYEDSANEALNTTGEISGAGTVSAVYTAQMQSTDFMFNKISGVLIPRQIRGMGGFYDVAQELSKDDSSRMTFTIFPKGEVSIMQLKVSEKYPNIAKDVSIVDPLMFLKVDQIKKSSYFSVGFFPLNSLIHVIVLPEKEINEVHVTNVIEPTIKDGQKIPSDLSKNGWFFDSESGEKIDAMYLFGEGLSANRQDLMLVIGDEQEELQTGFNETYILIGIGAAAAGAAAFYLKGIKKKN
ncbi:MAG TPA: hypothetical protein VGA92_09655 [Candidatus Nitrosotenuis sp.]